MADNISVKITADTSELQAQFAVAKAQSAALNAELNKLARDAAKGGMGAAVSADLVKAAEAASSAQQNVASLKSELAAAGAAPKVLGEGMSDLRHTLQGLVDPIRGVYNGVGELAEVFAAAAIIGGVASFGERIVENAARLQHESEVLGLSSEAYQDFAESARLAGVDITSTETALRRFVAAQGMAQEGQQSQRRAFDDLGVSADLVAEQAIPKVAAALLKLTDDGEKARIEMELFGRSGEELNPALEQWAQGTDALSQSLAKLGVVLDPKVTEAAEKADLSWELMADRLDADLTPAVVGATTAILNLLKDTSDAAQMPLFAQNLQWDWNASPQPQQPKWDPNDPRYHNNTQDFVTPQMPQVTAPTFDVQDPKKQAEAARRSADDLAAIWAQTQEKRIQGEEQANATLLRLGQETDAQFMARATELENDRYAIAVEGVRKRMAADAGDKAALAKDNADLEELEVEHQNRLAQIRADGAEKAQRADQQTVSEFVRGQETQVEAAIKSGNLTAATELQYVAAAQLAVDQRLNTEIASYAVGTEQYNAAVNEKLAADLRFQELHDQIIEQTTEKDKRAWASACREITGAEDTLIRDIFSKRQTLGADLLQITREFIEKELEADINYWTERALLAVEGVGKEEATQQGGVLMQGITALFGGSTAGAGVQTALTTQQIASLNLNNAQLAQLNAVLAAHGIATTANTTATTAGTAAQTAGTTATTANTAGQLETAASWVANTVATVANTAAEEAAKIGGFIGGLFGFAVGADNIPHDMVANIHKGEMIVPAGPAAALRNSGFSMASMSSSTVNNRGGDSATQNFTFNHATNWSDPLNFKDALESHAMDVARVIGNLVRNGSLRF